MCLQSLGKNIVCNRQGFSMPQPKITQLSIKMCASQPDGQRAYILTIFRTQVLGLGVNILVNVAVYPAIDENIVDRQRKMMLQRQY